MKFYKILFFISLMTGSLITISSTSWMGMWMGLEINLLSMIPLMNSSKNIFASEASLKYFIVQALASTILLFSIILMMNFLSMNFNFNEIFPWIFDSALLTKMGAAPFHFWFPEIIEGLSWLNSIILLTWQKLAPMVILIYNFNSPWFISFIIIISTMIGGIMGFNQNSIRKILAYSSINHIAWMLAAMFSMENIWFFYFLIYSIISINIIVMFNLLNIFFVNQLSMWLNNNISIKFFFIMNFLSLGGLPPFLGFFPKWLTIENLVMKNYLPLILILTMMTLITLYFYIRLTFSTLMLNINEINFTFPSKINQFWILTGNYISLLSLLACSILFNLT